MSEPLRPSAEFVETAPGLWVRKTRLDEDREQARRERLAAVVARLGSRITIAAAMTFDAEAAREAEAKAVQGGGSISGIGAPKP